MMKNPMPVLTFVPTHDEVGVGPGWSPGIAGAVDRGGNHFEGGDRERRAPLPESRFAGGDIHR